MTFILLILGVLVGSLAIAGLARMFSPESLANGFMSLDKLKALCPKLFERKKK